MIELNALLVFFLSIFTACSVSRWMLSRINIKHLLRHGHEVPQVFKGDIEEVTLAKMVNYTVDSSRLSSAERFTEDIVTLVILLSGFLPWMSTKILSFELNFVLSGLIFFFALWFISFAFEIPFNAYRSFVIEKKYEFSTITAKLWITDLVKGFILSVIIMVLLFGAFLWLLNYAKQTWWLWTWIVFSGFQLLMVWLYPVLIAPLFNKFEPIKDDVVKEAIGDLISKAGIKVENIYQIDAGKRSKHTNAYFTGLGKTKRIVLYDTLLMSHTTDEIIAVLAHEIGHFKKRHIMKQLVFMEIASLFVFYLFYRLMEWPLLYQTFGFEQNIPYVGVVLMAALFGPLAYFLTPIGSSVMRKFEREADEFAFDLTGAAVPLANGLKRLALDNSANLHPHPFYSWFYYSHPPLPQRIERLLKMEETRRLQPS